MTSFKTNIVRLDNSRGVRIPKALLEQCNLHRKAEPESRRTGANKDIKRQRRDSEEEIV